MAAQLNAMDAAAACDVLRPMPRPAAESRSEFQIGREGDGQTIVDPRLARILYSKPNDDGR